MEDNVMDEKELLAIKAAAEKAASDLSVRMDTLEANMKELALSMTAMEDLIRVIVENREVFETTH